MSYFNYITEVPENAVRPSDCDACLADRLRVRAESPYFEGPVLASESVYQSLTSSCNIAGKPLSTSTIDYFTAAPQPTQPTCDGTTYTIKSSDDCNSIAKAQGVGTAWLLADNNLDAFCVNFPSSGNLCITNQCKTVTLGTNETCSAVAAANNITETQLHAWNPIINMACSNLPAMNGTELCVDAPGRKFEAPSGTVPPLTPTVAVPRPSDAADGSTKPCARWYDVQKGDFCNALTLKFGISLADFLFLNPAVNENCTNLFAEESYCVQAVGDSTFSLLFSLPPPPIVPRIADKSTVNTYSGRPGFVSVTIDPSATFTGIPFTALPNATATGFTRYTPLPIANDTRDDCVHYFAGEDMQIDVNGTSWNSTCVFAAYMYEVDLDEFAAWNPGLGDVRSPSCAFQSGVRYCGSWYLQKAPEPTVIPTPTSSTASSTTSSSGTSKPTPPAPTHSGQPDNCNEWAVVEDGDNCDTMATAAGISRAQFLAWNPAVSSDCVQNFWLGYAYCVAVSGSTTTPPTTSSRTSTAPPEGPTKPPAEYLQEGQPDNCSKWDRAVTGDYCAVVAERNGLTVSQLAALNPVLGTDGADCGTMMWLNYYYCVDTS